MCLTRLEEFLLASDPERMMFDHLRLLMARSDNTASNGIADSAEPPLRVLLAGHVGAGNVGSEMRTAEIIRHVAFLLGRGNVSFTALLNGPFQPAFKRGEADVATLDGYIPETLVDLVDRHDAVLACEGSMLKSSFSNVLAGLMAGALGRAAGAGKLAVGYGAEIGRMEPVLEGFVKDTCGNTLFLCRNTASLERARALGLRAESGADTGWITVPAPHEQANSLLRQLGVEPPVVILCPTNPFWWPVRPNPTLAAQADSQPSLEELRFDGIFFHTYDWARKAAFDRYLDALAAATATICRDRGAQPLLVAMDPTDTRACQALQRHLGGSTPILLGHQHPVGLVVATLRLADFLISSRFHALVAAAPAAVPFAGVATDERIANLLDDSGCSDALVTADAPDLTERLVDIARRSDREAVQDATRRLVCREVCALGRMGMAFLAEVHRKLPNVPLPTRTPRWDAFLPALPPLIEKLLAS